MLVISTGANDGRTLSFFLNNSTDFYKLKCWQRTARLTWVKNHQRLPGGKAIVGEGGNEKRPKKERFVVT